jgi:surface antigen
MKKATMTRGHLVACAGALGLLLGGCAGWPTADAALYEELSENDVALAARTLQSALELTPDGTTRRWTNQETWHSGAISPIRTYLTEGGHFCRDYREELTFGARPGRFHHSACRGEDARWVWL